MKVIDDIVENSSLLKKIKGSGNSDLVFTLSGASIGEKVLAIYSLNRPCIVVVNDLLSMQAYKEGFNNLGVNISEFLMNLNAPIYSPFKDRASKAGLLKNIYDFIRFNNRSAVAVSSVKITC